MTVAVLIYGYMALMLAAAIINMLTRRRPPTHRPPSSHAQTEEYASCQRPK